MDPVTTAAAGVPALTLTPDMLQPIIDGVVSNVTAILPLGLGLFGMFLGIRILPGLFSRFTHM